MTTNASVAEITTMAITLLCREIGPVNTARFLGQFTSGFGNYTDERDEIMGNATVDQLVAEVKARRDKGIPNANVTRDPQSQVGQQRPHE